MPTKKATSKNKKSVIDYLNELKNTLIQIQTNQKRNIEIDKEQDKLKQDYAQLVVDFCEKHDYKMKFNDIEIRCLDKHFSLYFNEKHSRHILDFSIKQDLLVMTKRNHGGRGMGWSMFGMHPLEMAMENRNNESVVVEGGAKIKDDSIISVISEDILVVGEFCQMVKNFLTVTCDKYIQIHNEREQMDQQHREINNNIHKLKEEACRLAEWNEQITLPEGLIISGPDNNYRSFEYIQDEKNPKIYKIRLFNGLTKKGQESEWQNTYNLHNAFKLETA